MRLGPPQGCDSIDWTEFITFFSLLLLAVLPLLPLVLELLLLVGKRATVLGEVVRFEPLKGRLVFANPLPWTRFAAAGPLRETRALKRDAGVGPVKAEFGPRLVVPRLLFGVDGRLFCTLPVGVVERLVCVGVVPLDLFGGNVPDERNVGVVERLGVLFAVDGVDETPDRLGVVLRLALGVVFAPLGLVVLVLMIPLFGVVDRAGDGAERAAGALLDRVLIIPVLGVVDRVGVLKLPVDEVNFNFEEELGVKERPTVALLLGVVGRLLVDEVAPRTTLVGVVDRRNPVEPVVLEGVVGRLFVDPNPPLTTLVGVVDRDPLLVLAGRLVNTVDVSEGRGALTLRLVVLLGVETVGFDGVVERDGVVGVRVCVLLVDGAIGVYLFPAPPFIISRTDGDFALRGGEELDNREGDCSNARMRDVGV